MNIEYLGLDKTSTIFNHLMESLLNCGRCSPSHLCALLIIDRHLIRLRFDAPSPSLIHALRDFFLPCVVLLQLKGKVPMLCVFALINHSPTSLSSLSICNLKLFTCFFFFYFRLFVTPLFIQLFYKSISTFSVLFFIWNTLA